MGRTYDSVAAAGGVSGVFGVGWSSLLDSSLSVSISGGSQVAVWRQPSGAEVSFSDDGSGWVADSPVVTAQLSVSGGQFRVRVGDGTVYVFESGSSGVLRLVEVVDRNGYVLSLVWSGSQVQLVAHATPGSGAAAAGALTVSFAGSHVAQVRDPAGRKVIYSYTGDRLASVSSLGGGSWSYGYDSSARMTNMVDPAGSETVTSYDAAGRVAAQWDPDAVADGGVGDLSKATRFDYWLFAVGCGAV